MCTRDKQTAPIVIDNAIIDNGRSNELSADLILSLDNDNSSSLSDTDFITITNNNNIKIQYHDILLRL